MLSLASLVIATQVAPSRFAPAHPFPYLPWIKIDQRWAGASFADDACRKQSLQGRMIWIDGTANLDKINSAQKIRDLLAKIKDVGFNTVVLDVKPIVGRTLYPSKYTEQLTSWKGQSMPAGFDPVSEFRRVTSEQELSFFVSMNAFSEGHSYAKRDEGKPDTLFGKAGWGYDHPELQSYVYRKIKGDPQFIPSGMGQTQIPLMMNPHHPDVQARVLGFVKEIVSKYKPDGILFDDRYRFHGIDADFSPLTRKLYETRVARAIKWPDDVYAWNFDSEKVGLKPGPYFDDWLAFRADCLSRFLVRVRAQIKQSNPQTQFGIYAGSWYGDYSNYGSNYASTALQAGFPFLTAAYKKTGFSHLLDVLITGCYYKVATIYDALGSASPIGHTVEAAGDMSTRVAGDGCWVYGGLQLVDYKTKPKDLGKALQAAAATTQGVMVFDLSHDIADFWDTLKTAFRKPASAPHSIPNLLDSVRARREKWTKDGGKDRPFPIFEGAAGTGF